MNPTLESIGLSRMLKRHLQVDIPAQDLDPTEALGKIHERVFAALRESGQNFNERQLEETVTRIALANHTRTFHQVAFRSFCEKCGFRLGAESLRLGRLRRIQCADAAVRATNGLLVSFHFGMIAVCPHCAREYSYYNGDCSLRMREYEK